MQSRGPHSCLKLCWNRAEARHWCWLSRLYNKCQKTILLLAVVLWYLMLSCQHSVPTRQSVYSHTYTVRSQWLGHHFVQILVSHPHDYPVYKMQCGFMSDVTNSSHRCRNPTSIMSHLPGPLLYMLSVCSATTLGESFHAVARERGGWHGVTEWSYRILPAFL